MSNKQCPWENRSFLLNFLLWNSNCSTRSFQSLRKRKKLFGRVSLSFLKVKGAHRCHPAIGGYIVTDALGVHVNAALLHWQCQITHKPSAACLNSFLLDISVARIQCRAFLLSDIWNWPLLCSAGNHWEQQIRCPMPHFRPSAGAGTHNSLLMRVEKEFFGWHINEPLHTRLLLQRGGWRYANVTLSRAYSLTVTHPD